MNIVIDTNVLISAALSPMGNPAKIIRLVADDENICCYYSADILNKRNKLAHKINPDLSNEEIIKLRSDIIKFREVFVKINKYFKKTS